MSKLKTAAFCLILFLFVFLFAFLPGCTCDDSDDDDDDSANPDDDDDDDNDDNDDNDDDDDNDDNDDDTTNPGEALCKSFETAPGDTGYKWTNKILYTLGEDDNPNYHVAYSGEILYVLWKLWNADEGTFATFLARYDGTQWVQWQLAYHDGPRLAVDGLAIDSQGGVWTIFTDFDRVYSGTVFNIARWEDGQVAEMRPVNDYTMYGVYHLYCLPGDLFTFTYYHGACFAVMEEQPDHQWVEYLFDFLNFEDFAPDPNGVLLFVALFGDITMYVRGAASTGFTYGLAGWSPAYLLYDLSASVKMAIDSSGNAYFTVYLEDSRIWLGKFDGLTTEYTLWREETISIRDFQGAVGHGVDDQDRPYIIFPTGIKKPNINCFIYKNQNGIHSEIIGGINEMVGVWLYDQASGTNGRVASIMAAEESMQESTKEKENSIPNVWHVVVAYREPIN